MMPYHMDMNNASALNPVLVLAAVVEPAAELADPGGDPPRLRRLPHLRRGQGAPPAPHQQTGKVSQYQMETVLI